jgi:hypothetical protein
MQKMYLNKVKKIEFKSKIIYIQHYTNYENLIYHKSN